MKKIIMIGGAAYTVICIGVCIYMLIDPEGYGKMIGKIVSGVCKGIDE